jgi:predicted secreted protein
VSRRATLVLLALAGLAELAAGCARARVYREGNAAVAGRPGDTVVIELASDPATGYSWAMVGQPDPTVAALMNTEFAVTPSPTSGTAGHERWTFRLVAPGTTRITFGFGRTWANAPAEKATTFSVVVK